MPRPPAETCFYFSGRKLLPWLLVFAVGAGACWWLLLHWQPVLTLRYLFVCGGAGLFPFGFLHALGQLLGRRPQLQLGQRGIRVRRRPLDGWRSIQDERVTGTVLRYRTPDGERAIALNDLATSAEAVSYLLRYYRQHADYGPRPGPRRRRFEL